MLGTFICPYSLSYSCMKKFGQPLTIFIIFIYKSLGVWISNFILIYQIVDEP